MMTLMITKFHLKSMFHYVPEYLCYRTKSKMAVQPNRVQKWDPRKPERAQGPNHPLVVGWQWKLPRVSNDNFGCEPTGSRRSQLSPIRATLETRTGIQEAHPSGQPVGSPKTKAGKMED
jgi:hypothetical protein